MVPPNNRIKELRQQHNMTLSDLSKASGVSVSSLSAYERGDRQPKIQTLDKIAQVFNVQPSFIQGKSDAPRDWSRLNQAFTSMPGMMHPNIPDAFRETMKRLSRHGAGVQSPQIAPILYAMDSIQEILSNIESIFFGPDSEKVDPSLLVQINEILEQAISELKHLEDKNK